MACLYIHVCLCNIEHHKEADNLLAYWADLLQGNYIKKTGGRKKTIFITNIQGVSQKMYKVAEKNINLTILLLPSKESL